MDRAVPEFALVVGAVLGLAVLAAGVLFTDDLPVTVLVAALVAYPFVAYAVHESDDPTGVLPPRVTLGLAALAGLAVLGDATYDALAAGASPRAVGAAAVGGALLALGVVLPAVAYQVAYGRRLNPLDPRETAGLAAAGGLALLLGGLAVGAAVAGAVAGVLLFVAGGLYATRRGVRVDRRTRRGVVLAGAAVGVAVVATGVLRWWALDDALVVGIAAILGPSVLYGLTVERMR